jgi:O-antigen/teichoic acid export membrane protein
MVKRNIIANWLGQGWSVLMGLAFVPVYIRYLGVEAYGLIGLFVVIQAWLSLLDMGITPTLNREMARFTAGAHTSQSINNLLRSMEVICFTLAALIAFIVWSGSGYLANDWLKAEQLPVGVVSQAIAIMAFVVALRFCEGIYRGSLLGLQYQIWYNGAYAALSTVRHVGVIGILVWISPTIEAFFIWQGVLSLVTVSVFALKVHRTLPRPPSRARFSGAAISDVWVFAGGMAVTTLLTLLLTQVDKILLSRLLTLESFGYYALAAAVVGILSTVTSPIAQAVYPRLVELATQHDQSGLVSVYHRAPQLVTVFTAPIVMLLVFYADGILFAWSGDVALAENTAPILSVLVLGTFLNCLMIIPYMLQIAHGWTGLVVKTNLVAVVILIPAIIMIVPIYGAVGAAWIWFFLNAGYILVIIQFMHRRLVPGEKWRWYRDDVGLPMMASLIIVLALGSVRPECCQDRGLWFVFLAIASGLALATSILMARDIRHFFMLHLIAAVKGT